MNGNRSMWCLRQLVMAIVCKLAALLAMAPCLPSADVEWLPNENYHSMVLERFAAADQHIDVMVYAINLPEARMKNLDKQESSEPSGHPVYQLLDSLIAAHERGVAVRVLLDDGTDWQGERQTTNDLAARYLFQAGVPVRYDEAERRTHAKSVAIDQMLITGSTNWSFSALRRNREHAVIITNTQVNQAFREAFDRAWASADVSLAGMTDR